MLKLGTKGEWWLELRMPHSGFSAVSLGHGADRCIHSRLRTEGLGLLGKVSHGHLNSSITITIIIIVIIKIKDTKLSLQSYFLSLWEHSWSTVCSMNDGRIL